MCLTPARLLILIAVPMVSAMAQTRPDTRPESRAGRSLFVRAVPFPVKGDASVPSGCSFSPDGRFLATVRGSELPRVYDFTTAALVAAVGGANWPPVFSSKSDRVAFTVERGISINRREAGRWVPEATIALPFEPWVVFPCPRTIAWSSDDSVMMFAEKGQAYELVLRTGEARAVDCGKGRAVATTFLGQWFGVYFLREDGSETVLLSDRKVVERIPNIGILACSSGKDSWLVVRGERQETWGRPRTGIEIWDAKSRKVRAKIGLTPVEGDDSGLTQAAFSSDGSILVTGDGFKRAVIRDGHTGEILHTVRHYEGDRLVAVAISPDGRHLLTMGRPREREDEDVAGVVLWELTFDHVGK
jgi:WD40 repeat protein